MAQGMTIVLLLGGGDITSVRYDDILLGLIVLAEAYLVFVVASARLTTSAHCLATAFAFAAMEGDLALRAGRN